jgi:hypothetical protein
LKGVNRSRRQVFLHDVVFGLWPNQSSRRLDATTNLSLTTLLKNLAHRIRPQAGRYNSRALPELSARAMFGAV